MDLVKVDPIWWANVAGASNSSQVRCNAFSAIEASLVTPGLRLQAQFSLASFLSFTFRGQPACASFNYDGYSSDLYFLRYTETGTCSMTFGGISFSQTPTCPPGQVWPRFF